MNDNNYVDINAHDNYPDSKQKIEIPTMKVIPLKKICMTIGELPTSYLETMTYYEMLIWFINYLRDNIIPTVNGNGKAVEELQTVVMELQNYINDYKDSIDSDVEELEEYMNNYFENLDVQEEINNKLDDMLEDGVLEQIIEQYLNSTALWCFDSVNDMKNAKNLIKGSYAKTLGYYEPNDGGGATYIIKDTAVADGYAIHELTNGYFAELVVNGKLYSSQIGVSEDLNDNSGPLNFFFQKSAIYGKTVLQKGNYRVTQPLTMYLSSSIELDGIVRISDYIEENTTTINITKLQSEIDSTGRSYAKTILGTNGGVLEVRNYVEEDYPNKIGMAFGSSDYSVNGIIKNIRFIGGYAIGLKITPLNVYWLKMENIIYSGNVVGLNIDSTINRNSGELIQVERNCWSRCDCGIKIESYFNMIFNHCAWDFVKCCFYATEIGEFVCDKCHFEGVGTKDSLTVGNYNGFGGIFHSNDTELTYRQTHLKISNSHIISSTLDDCYNKMFEGKSLYVLLENNALVTFAKYNDLCKKDNNFTYAWLTNENIREIKIVNCHSEQQKYYQNFYLQKDNLIDMFLEEENTTEEINIPTTAIPFNTLILDMKNYELVHSGITAAGTKVQVVTLENNKKMIKITPPDLNKRSAMILRTKKKFSIDTIRNIFALGYTKGRNPDNSLRIDISFFDEENNYISSINNINTNSENINSENWFTFSNYSKFRTGSTYVHPNIPKNASYFKIDFYMIASYGASIEPAYFTGFYINI